MKEGAQPIRLRPFGRPQQLTINRPLPYSSCGILTYTRGGLMTQSRAATGHGADARLNFRIDPQIKQMIERAAEYSGETITSYAVATLVRDARRVIEEHEMTVLTDAGRDAFLDLLDNPPAPNKALRNAAARYREMVDNGRLKI